MDSKHSSCQFCNGTIIHDEIWGCALDVGIILSSDELSSDEYEKYLNKNGIRITINKYDSPRKVSRKVKKAIKLSNKKEYRGKL